MSIVKSSDDIVIGTFYELPDGRIAHTCGWEGKDRLVTYYLDNNEGSKKATYEEYKTWKHRRDLRDFPNARDPRLPYVFDLLWDIKYMSQLKDVLSGKNWGGFAIYNWDDVEDIKETMIRNNIKISCKKPEPKENKMSNKTDYILIKKERQTNDKLCGENCPGLFDEVHDTYGFTCSHFDEAVDLVEKTELDPFGSEHFKRCGSCMAQRGKKE